MLAVERLYAMHTNFECPFGKGDAAIWAAFEQVAI